MPVVELPQGPVHFSDRGAGRAVLCVHGYLMGEELFAPLAERLARSGLRCIAPTWPLGAHRAPMAPGADLSPAGLARLVADFCAALDLRDVVLPGSDTGGAIAQVVVTTHPERIGALVLLSCDAFDNCPPGFFRHIVAAARVPGGLALALAGLRSAVVRRSPLAYGLLSHGSVDDLAAAWVVPVLTSTAVRRDLRQVTLGLGPDVTLRAAALLPGFARPALVAWSADDALFPLEHARRLADLLPAARLELVESSRTFSMIDQPERLAALVARFAAPSPAGPTP